jgi:peptide/nickel transport system substrate-binding protein
MTRIPVHPRRHGTTILVAALIGALASCAPRDRRTPDDTLVLVIEAAMNTSDPRFTISNHDSKLAKLIHVGLTAVDTPTMQPRLELASRVERIDPVTWEVELRPDAKFSDGAPVLAKDVVFTYESMLAEDSPSLYHRNFSDRFTGVEAVTERIVRFHLREPLSTFETDIDFGIISEAGKGAGPYVLRELTTTHASLAVNPHYFGDKPRVPNVEIKFVKDASARLLMLVGGSADLIQNGVRLDLIDEVAARPRVKISAAPSALLTYVMLNNADAAFGDVRVRQAIALAIDRPALIEAKFGGRAVLATGLMPPTHFAYNPNVQRWERDLPRARRLLDEAGLRDPDGNGPRPRLKVTYKTSADAFRVSIARVIAAQLADIGIEVEVRAFEFGTFFADIKKGSFQIASMQTAEITNPDFYFTYFHSSRIPDAKNPDGGNRWRYRNAEVDRLTVEGKHELDAVKRKLIYDRVQEIVAAEVPIIPLWHEDNVVLTNVDVSGYTITPNARLGGLRTTTKAH